METNTEYKKLNCLKTGKNDLDLYMNEKANEISTERKKNRSKLYEMLKYHFSISTDPLFSLFSTTTMFEFQTAG